MCIEKSKRVKPFKVGYKVMIKKDGGYTPSYDYECGELRKLPPIRLGECVCEFPYRQHRLLSLVHTGQDLGWHIFKCLKDAKGWFSACWKDRVIVKVYGYDPICFGHTGYPKPICGVFRFMVILEEVSQWPPHI